DFRDPSAVNGAQGAETALAQCSFALKLALRFDREPRPGNRVQSRLRDLFAGQFADAVGALFDPFERFFNFIDGILIGGKQAEGKVAFEIVRARIGDVISVAGQLFSSFFVTTGIVVAQ